MARSVLETGTAKTASVAMLAGLMVAIAPFGGNVASRHANNERTKADIADITQIIITIGGLFAIGGGGLSILNRASSKDKAYAADWLPGYNKSDLVAEESNAILAQKEQRDRVINLTERAVLAEQGQNVAVEAIADVLGKVPVEILSNSQDMAGNVRSPNMHEQVAEMAARQSIDPADTNIAKTDLQPEHYLA